MIKTRANLVTFFKKIINVCAAADAGFNRDFVPTGCATAFGGGGQEESHLENITRIKIYGFECEHGKYVSTAIGTA